MVSVKASDWSSRRRRSYRVSATLPTVHHGRPGSGNPQVTLYMFNVRYDMIEEFNVDSKAEYTA